MNDLSANDILLFGALAGVLVVIVLGLCWAVAHRGRQRFNTERRTNTDLAAQWEDRARKQFECAGRTNDPMGKRVMEHGATIYFNCAQELKATPTGASPRPAATP